MASKTLYIMQGVPGSGKSTIARMLAASETTTSHPDNAIIRSTDDYRYRGCGHYFHDVEENAEFHKRTQCDVADDMRDGIPTIIVDNTNIEKWQAQPYVVLASIYDYDVQVIRVDPGLKRSLVQNAKRPVERRVPDEVIINMHNRLENLV